jgi:hypothetical protein
MPPRLTMLLGALAALLDASLAIDHGHHDPPPSTTGHQSPYLHVTLGDAVWIQQWVPQNRGSVAGACVGLVLLGILERWLAALHALLSASSIQRYLWRIQTRR